MILKMEHAINNSMKIKYYSTLSYNLTMIIALLVLQEETKTCYHFYVHSMKVSASSSR